MEVFTKSIVKWSEPKSFNEYYEKKINDLNSKSKIIYARYVYPTIISIGSVIVIFTMLSVVLDVKFFSFGLYFCLVVSLLATPIIQLAKKYDRKTIYFYQNKILIYGSDEGRQDIKIKELQNVHLEEYVDGDYKCDILKMFNHKGKEYSTIINHDISLDIIRNYFKERNIKLT